MPTSSQTRVTEARSRLGFGAAILASAGAIGLAMGMFFFVNPGVSMPEDTASRTPPFQELVGNPDQIARLSIVELNLMCAEGLRGEEQQDHDRSRARLTAMVARVRSETERHLHRFRNDPASYEHSEGFFRMLMMAVVLVEDFGVRYDPERRIDPAVVRMGDGFFADANEVFVSGLLREQPSGTCSSLPVLYVAIGRELGYPLKLVTTKGHLFVRWEGSGDRFNVETTGQGLNRLDDEYFQRWPFPLTAGEIEKEDYLTSLTPAGELAVFLSIRAMCLLEAGQVDQARKCFDAAAKLNPKCQSYRLMADGAS